MRTTKELALLHLMNISRNEDEFFPSIALAQPLEEGARCVLPFSCGIQIGFWLRRVYPIISVLTRALPEGNGPHPFRRGRRRGPRMGRSLRTKILGTLLAKFPTLQVVWVYFGLKTSLKNSFSSQTTVSKAISS